MMALWMAIRWVMVKVDEQGMAMAVDVGMMINTMPTGTVGMNVR